MHVLAGGRLVLVVDRLALENMENKVRLLVSRLWVQTETTILTRQKFECSVHENMGMSMYLCWIIVRQRMSQHVLRCHGQLVQLLNHLKPHADAEWIGTESFFARCRCKAFTAPVDGQHEVPMHLVAL